MTDHTLARIDTDLDRDHHTDPSAARALTFAATTAVLAAATLVLTITATAVNTPWAGPAAVLAAAAAIVTTRVLWRTATA